jgi:hypothetical protein
MRPVPACNFTDQVLLVKNIMQKDGQHNNGAVQRVPMGQNKIIIWFLFLAHSYQKDKLRKRIADKGVLTPGLAVFDS